MRFISSVKRDSNIESERFYERQFILQLWVQCELLEEVMKY